MPPHFGRMNSFRNHRLRDFFMPMSTNWLLIDLAEAKGKQGLYALSHDSQHDQMAWLNHFFAIARHAYCEFEQRVGDMKSRCGGKTELVCDAIEATVGEFGVTNLERVSLSVSRDLIRLRLRVLKAARRINCRGHGVGTKWRKRVLPLKEGKRQSYR